MNCESQEYAWISCKKPATVTLQDKEGATRKTNWHFCKPHAKIYVAEDSCFKGQVVA